MSNFKTLFVGIGSAHGDDRAGWEIGDQLRVQIAETVDVRQASTPSQLLDWLEGVDRLIVCDACQARPRSADCPSNDSASVHRWEWPTSQVETLRSADSHSFGLPQVLQLAERLGNLPSQVIVFAIEASSFDAFSELSPEVTAALPDLISGIAGEMSRTDGGRAGSHRPRASRPVGTGPTLQPADADSEASHA